MLKRWEVALKKTAFAAGWSCKRTDPIGKDQFVRAVPRWPGQGWRGDGFGGRNTAS
ncbi:MAG: hypothetical protein NVS4B8_21230 [Herpetosiphon sp.]